jgi:hypothetical protein
VTLTELADDLCARAGRAVSRELVDTRMELRRIARQLVAALAETTRRMTEIEDRLDRLEHTKE